MNNGKHHRRESPTLHRKRKDISEEEKGPSQPRETESLKLLADLVGKLMTKIDSLESSVKVNSEEVKQVISTSRKEGKDEESVALGSKNRPPKNSSGPAYKPIKEPRAERSFTEEYPVYITSYQTTVCVGDLPKASIIEKVTGEFKEVTLTFWRVEFSPEENSKIDFPLTLTAMHGRDHIYSSWKTRGFVGKSLRKSGYTSTKLVIHGVSVLDRIGRDSKPRASVFLDIDCAEYLQVTKVGTLKVEWRFKCRKPRDPPVKVSTPVKSATSASAVAAPTPMETGSK